MSNTVNVELRKLFAPHVDSFDFFLDEGLSQAILLSPKTYATSAQGEVLEMWFSDPIIGSPIKHGLDQSSRILYPRECRESKITYSSSITITINARFNDVDILRVEKRICTIPIMVMSKKCRLKGLNSDELVQLGEEMNECGGYFIINGLEKLIRMIIIPRRNYPLAYQRNKFIQKGRNFTNFAVQMRCVREDQSSSTIVMHYLVDGTVRLRFKLRRQDFFLPVVLAMRAFADVTDKQIFDDVSQGEVGNSFILSCLEVILMQCHENKCFTKRESLAYIGKLFRAQVRWPPQMKDEECGQDILNNYILINLKNGQEKYQMLCLMLRKLLLLASGALNNDNLDSPEFHEVLLSGHLISMLLKESFSVWMQQFRRELEKNLELNPQDRINDINVLKKCIDKVKYNVSKRIEYLLSTGNLQSESGLDLQQVTGFTINAERLNYLRFISHFRSVHRGHYFTEMKTTEVRKLLPQSWGFVCPVHTPDGAPCGLLNHLASQCEIVQTQRTDQVISSITSELVSVGMTPISERPLLQPDDSPCLIDGIIIGYIKSSLLESVGQRLRLIRVLNPQLIPPTAEIICITSSQRFSFPLLYIQTTPSRYMRPIKHIQTGKQTWIGSLEQTGLDIACLPADITPNTQFEEISLTAMLSVVASLTPFSDYNQSPRNLYQCQMGKQSMGFPVHSLAFRSDLRMYRLTHPQKPIVRTIAQDKYQIDDYPTGTNACVAVISYTGFDMEDAMIVCKSSYERGFGHGAIHTTNKIDLSEVDNKSLGHGSTSKNAGSLGDGENEDNLNDNVSDDDHDNETKTEISKGKRNKETYAHFTNIDPQTGNLIDQGLDFDGVPSVGTRVTDGDALCAYITQDGKIQIKRYKGPEDGIIESVSFVTKQMNKGFSRMHHNSLNPHPHIARIKLRINRNPIIGDKFSSRHGQKGVLSVLWPQIDMPFTESGITPDCIINPHAFPSRMTIGMLIEAMSGKAGASHGMFQDATPFEFNRNKGTQKEKEDPTLIQFIGEQLVRAGFNYHGNEPMYSGVSGELLKADIFFGLVYYQRLRHMVNDKFQVRTTGPVDPLTKQPIQGRKLGGGLRLGEMERDSLLSHGVSYILQDRLFHCSDEHETLMCTLCGSILSVISQAKSSNTSEQLNNVQEKICLLCNSSKFISKVRIPYVLLYLTNELAGMNLRLRFEAKSFTQDQL